MRRKEIGSASFTLLAATVLVGCATTATPSSIASEGIGTLTGAVRLHGGPAGLPQPRPGSYWTVTVSLNGRVVTSIRAGNGGAFQAALPAGEYVLTACGVPVPVKVKSGQISHRVLDCQIT